MTEDELARATVKAQKHYRRWDWLMVLLCLILVPVALFLIGGLMSWLTWG